MENLLLLRILGITVTFAFLVYQVYLCQKYHGWEASAWHKIFSVLFAAVVVGILVVAISYAGLKVLQILPFILYHGFNDFKTTGWKTGEVPACFFISYS